MNNKINNIYCANCGNIGHIYKSCNHPVTSLGIICYRLQYDNENNCIYPEYLMVQRKDSLSYVEFLRGKYNLQNKNYLFTLFSNMTESERQRIRQYTFDTLWKELWQLDNVNSNFQKEYYKSKKKFNLLINGYIIKTFENQNYVMNIDTILNNSVSYLKETEWGFPKGRRNINECDFDCAKREFCEETGFNIKDVDVKRYQKPFEEVFTGSNRVRYKHIYYLALLINFNNIIKNSKSKMVEIKDVKWFRFKDAIVKIGQYNIERLELFKRVNGIILNNYINDKNLTKQP